ncbi:MAG: pitrilysin family protein [Pseudomonadota bacterium]
MTDPRSKIHRERKPLKKTYKRDHTFRKTVLDNGVRILSEEAPYLKSVSTGVWVHSGSRFENENLGGISHFLEHMLFKGTQKRDALQLAKEIDAVGGTLNAYTSKELTAFYCTVLTENLDLASDLLTDIFLNSCFPEQEIEREKQVVYQEIYQLEDNPEDLVNELFYKRLWDGDPFGRPIMGTVGNVKAFERNNLVAFKAENYVPSETIVCAVGNLDHDKLVDMIRPEMERLKNGGPKRVQTKPKTASGVDFREKSSEQVHFCFGSEGPCSKDKDRHAANIFSTIFGGGMSSRLFQEVREKRGLAYGIYSYYASYSDTGAICVSACTEPNMFEELLEVVGKETLSMRDSITLDEFQAAKINIRGNLILANEASDSRINRLVKGEIYYGDYVSLDEIIDNIESVTFQEIRDFSSRLIDSQNFTACIVGPVSPSLDIMSYFTS